MNPLLVKLILTTAVNAGLRYHAQRQLRQKNASDNALGEYVVRMINDGKVEMDEFDAIALRELGIKIVQEEA